MAATLACKQCAFENEAERIYCHNCGAKLDRSVLPTQKTEVESVSKARDRVKKLTNPNSGFFAGALKTLISTLLWSALTAAVIEAALPPDGVPPAPKKGDLDDAPPLAMQLEEANAQPVRQSFIIREEIINSYLRHAVKARSAEGILGDTVKFDRAFVNLRPGAIRITSQQNAFDYPLYSGAEYQLAIQNNKLVATSVGGNIGRLPVHPMLMQYSDLLFQKLWDALAREHKLMDGLYAVEVQKNQIFLTTKGSR